MTKSLFVLATASIFFSCTTTRDVVKTIPTKPIQSFVAESQSPKGLKRKVAIARFSNETLYGKGAFYNKENDPLEKQATDILSSTLAQSEKFIFIEKSDDFGGAEKNKYGFSTDDLLGVDYIIVGSISEFGRKDVTDSKLFSRTREQIAMATVNIRLVDVKTGQIIYGEIGSGQSSTQNKTSLGVGSRASYDSSLNDQAISAAVSKLIDNIINKLTDSPWKSYILDKQEGFYLISGGKSQGIELGNVFVVEQMGKKVKNPQTGGFITLPGKKVAKIKVAQVLPGQNVKDEISMCQIVEGEITSTDYSNLIILEDEI